MYLKTELSEVIEEIASAFFEVSARIEEYCTVVSKE
jgi:hypothetical protein